MLDSILGVWVPLYSAAIVDAAAPGLHTLAIIDGRNWLGIAVDYDWESQAGGATFSNGYLLVEPELPQGSGAYIDAFIGGSRWGGNALITTPAPAGGMRMRTVIAPGLPDVVDGGGAQPYLHRTIAARPQGPLRVRRNITAGTPWSTFVGRMQAWGLRRAA